MPEGISQRPADQVQGKAPRRKILLVDGDSHDLQLYASVLREQGHVVDSCATFAEGAERLECAWYDLIILNQEGGTFQGQPLLERAVELNRYRPVLVLARCVDMRSYIDAMYLGALDYMEKPLAACEIVRTVSNCLSHVVVLPKAPMEVALPS